MDVTTYQKIVEKIKQLETELARTEGQRAQVIQELKTLFKVETVEEAEALLATMRKEHAVLVAKQDEQFAKLQGLTDWTMI